VNVNYLLIEGLERSGFLDVAWAFRRSTLEMMYSRGGIYEYFHPQPGGKPPEAAAIFGWSSAIFVDLAIQEARENIGIHLNKLGRQFICLGPLEIPMTCA
jgi:glycogen debranching enzyme